MPIREQRGIRLKRKKGIKQKRFEKEENNAGREQFAEIRKNANQGLLHKNKRRVRKQLPRVQTLDSKMSNAAMRTEWRCKYKLLQCRCNQWRRMQSRIEIAIKKQES